MINAHAQRTCLQQQYRRKQNCSSNVKIINRTVTQTQQNIKATPIYTHWYGQSTYT